MVGSTWHRTNAGASATTRIRTSASWRNRRNTSRAIARATSCEEHIQPWDQLMTDEQRRELAGLLSILQSATRLHAQGGDVIGGSRERAIAQARHEIFALVDRWLPEQTVRA